MVQDRSSSNETQLWRRKANPNVQKQTGAVMSSEGVLKNKKHGGAHELTHEVSEEGEISLTGQYIITEDLIKHRNTDTGCGKFQDGGRKDNGNGVHSDMPENLHFLTEELDSYDQEVVENNTEWLKSRCKNLDHVDFDISSSSAGEDNLGFPTISIENKSLLQSDACDNLTISRLQGDDITRTPTATDCTLTLADTAASSSQVVPVVNQTAEMSENAYLVSMDADLPVLNAAAEMSLENIMFASEKRLASDITGEVEFGEQKGEQIITDFDNTIEANTVINGANTKVRLCVNKDGVLTLIPIEDQLGNTSLVKDSSMDTDNQIHLENLRVNQKDADNPSVSLAGLMEGLEGQAVVLGNGLDAGIQQTNIQPVSQPSSQAFATISIQTDKLSNSTKILVDTSQGRQVYQLNISDLTGSPQTPASVVSNLNQVQPALNNPTVASPNQDESQAVKMMPGYVLLTVSNPEGSETNLVPSIVNSKPDHAGTKEKAGKDQMYMCSHVGCGKLFKTLPKLTVHVMSHTGERPYKCSEPGCEWAFTKAYKLKRHEESHKGKKDHVCSYCNKKFTTIYNLKSHIKQHSRPCTEECPVEDCQLKFQTRRELDKHMKTHEGIEKTYKCPFEGCNKLFLSPHCLGSHPRVHMSEPVDLTCQFEGCGRKFDKLCRLKQHQRSHTGERPYICHFSGCNWAFSTASKLTRHMTKHTNNRKWICKECGKAFMRAEHLKGHMITHTGIKPFTCPVEGCGQKFVAKSSVYIHLKKHDTADQEITYHCPMEACNRKYTNKAKLRQHIVKHFPGTLSPEDAAKLDIVPLLKHEEQTIEAAEDEGEEEVAARAVSTTVVQPRAVNVKTEPDGKIKIDPLEFMATTINRDGEVTNTSVANQFTAQLTAELSTMVASSSGVQTVTSPTTSTTKPVMKKDPGESTGSARTDYHSNMLLSDRAKKRRKLLREMAEGSCLPDEAMEAQTAANSLRDSLGSHGITFRDPETGVMYVQTQLLQDDPPHPDLYADDNVLNGELSLHDSSDTDMNDSGDQVAEFVGSTINLQDLVG